MTERTYLDGLKAALAACRMELNTARGGLHEATVQGSGETRNNCIVEMSAIFLCIEKIDALIDAENRR